MASAEKYVTKTSAYKKISSRNNRNVFTLLNTVLHTVPIHMITVCLLLIHIQSFVAIVVYPLECNPVVGCGL